jgi:hypothetical protein
MIFYHQFTSWTENQINEYLKSRKLKSNIQFKIVIDFNWINKIKKTNE